MQAGGREGPERMDVSWVQLLGLVLMLGHESSCELGRVDVHVSLL